MKFRVWDIENKQYLHTSYAVFMALCEPEKYVLECGFTTTIRGEDVTIFEGDVFCTKYNISKKVVRFSDKRGCFEICSIDKADRSFVNDWSGISPGWLDELFDKVVGNVREGIKDV